MSPPASVGHGGVFVGIGIVVTFSMVAGLLRSFATDVPARAAEDWSWLAFALVVATPAVLALVGLQHRPWFLVAAGIVLLPMCFLSFTFLFFPLFISALLFMSDAIARPRPMPRPRAQCVAASLSVLFVVAAFLSLFARADPVTWHTATASGGVSDVITLQEALTSLGFLIAAVAVAVLAPADGTQR